MRVQLVYSPDCPNIEAARSNLREALASTGLPEEWEEVDVSRDGGSHLAGHGSPAVLIDGKDVTGYQPGDAACCRVYGGGDGGFVGAPEVSLIAGALRAPAPARWLPAWVGGLSLAAIGVSSLGLCPACWPAYVSVLSVLGLPFAGCAGHIVPLVLLAMAVLPLMRLVVERRAWDAALAVSTGAVLILESRWIQWPALGVFGALLVILGAFVTMSRGRTPQAILIQIGRG